MIEVNRFLTSVCRNFIFNEKKNVMAVFVNYEQGEENLLPYRKTHVPSTANWILAVSNLLAHYN